MPFSKKCRFKKNFLFLTLIRTFYSITFCTHISLPKSNGQYSIKYNVQYLFLSNNYICEKNGEMAKKNQKLWNLNTTRVLLDYKLSMDFPILNISIEIFIVRLLYS